MSKDDRNLILHGKMYEISSKVKTNINIVSYNTKSSCRIHYLRVP